MDVMVALRFRDNVGWIFTFIQWWMIDDFHDKLFASFWFFVNNSICGKVMAELNVWINKNDVYSFTWWKFDPNIIIRNSCQTRISYEFFVMFGIFYFVSYTQGHMRIHTLIRIIQYLHKSIKYIIEQILKK